MTVNLPSQAGALGPDPARAQPVPRPLGLRVVQVTDPNAPPLLRGKWQVVGADGVHLATCNTRAAAKRVAVSIETLHRLGAKLGTR